jgi:hypothetical protein
MPHIQAISGHRPPLQKSRGHQFFLHQLHLRGIGWRFVVKSVQMEKSMRYVQAQLILK